MSWANEIGLDDAFEILRSYSKLSNQVLSQNSMMHHFAFKTLIWLTQGLEFDKMEEVENQMLVVDEDGSLDGK